MSLSPKGPITSCLTGKFIQALWSCIVPYVPNPVGNVVDFPGLEPSWWVPTALLNKLYPDPDKDPFYQVGEIDLNSYDVGEIVKSRKAMLNMIVKFAWGVLDSAGKDHQIYYRTTDTYGKPQGGIATIIEPAVPAKNPGILAQQAYTDAASHSCCQSWGLTWLSNSTAWLTLPGPDSGIPIKTALDNGHYVVITDFEGPKHGFAVGRQAGHTILDGIRATINYYHLSSNTSVVLTGYSGGGHATSWAANLAPSYAQELNVVGAAYGGAPIDMLKLIKNLADKPFGGLGIAGLVGMANIYDDFNDEIFVNLKDAGKAMMKHVRSPGTCLMTLLKHYAMGSNRTIWDYFKDGEKILENKLIANTIKNETLLDDNEDLTVPEFPRYIYHGTKDDIIPIDPMTQYVTQQCNGRAKIWYDEVHLADHMNAPTRDDVKLKMKYFVKTALAGSLSMTDKCGGPWVLEETHELAESKQTTSTDDQAERLQEYISNAIWHRESI